VKIAQLSKHFVSFALPLQVAYWTTSLNRKRFRRSLMLFRYFQNTDIAVEIQHRQFSMTQWYVIRTAIGIGEEDATSSCLHLRHIIQQRWTSIVTKCFWNTGSVCMASIRQSLHCQSFTAIRISRLHSKRATCSNHLYRWYRASDVSWFHGFSIENNLISVDRVRDV